MHCILFFETSDTYSLHQLQCVQKIFLCQKTSFYFSHCGHFCRKQQTEPGLDLQTTTERAALMDTCTGEGGGVAQPRGLSWTKGCGDSLGVGASPSTCLAAVEMSLDSGSF